MKKFAKKVLVYFVCIMLVCIVPGVVVDPYNVFHAASIRNNGVEPNKNYVKTKYILSNPNKYDGFLFGSSKVGSIHTENIPDHNVYNMTYSHGTIGENLDSLKTFVESGIRPEIVYVGVDSLTYTHTSSEHYDLALRCSYQYLKAHPLHFAELYLDPKMIASSLSTIMSGNDTPGYSSLYDYGWWCEYDTPTEIDWSTASPTIGEIDYMDETLSIIEEMVEYCGENDIELVVFTNPMCQVTYDASVEMGYMDFLRGLAEITDYYNFSGMNDITSDNNNFVDTAHYNAEVGDLMLDAMCKDSVSEELLSQGFGAYVTRENVENLINILEK